MDKTCRWYSAFEGTCCNGDSAYRGGWPEPETGCEKWDAILKPCPFCGAEPELRRHTFHVAHYSEGNQNSYGVRCKCCGAQTSQWHNTPEEAREAWNRRKNATENT